MNEDENKRCVLKYRAGCDGAYEGMINEAAVQTDIQAPVCPAGCNASPEFFGRALDSFHLLSYPESSPRRDCLIAGKQIVNKYSLPCVCKLSHIKFDLKKLRDALIPFAERFTDVHSANGGLCRNHCELADSVKNHFFQISLTTCRTDIKNPVEERSAKKMKRGTEEEPLTRSQKYRLAVSKKDGCPSRDERNWNVPTKPFLNSYFYECVSRFKSPAIRARLTTLRPGKVITPHIDYNVNYAVRIVVPIYTNDRCRNYFWRRGKKIKAFIPADGHPYFLNVAFRHSVENAGDSPRTVLMFSLKGMDDIQHLIDQKANPSDGPLNEINLRAKTHWTRSNRNQSESIRG